MQVQSPPDAQLRSVRNVESDRNLSPLAEGQEFGSVIAAAPVQVHFEIDKKLSYEIIKRVFDIFGAAVLLILTFPISVVTALAIKLSDGGPMFYVHQRVGLGGREFRCIKFRSMKADADRHKLHLASQNKHPDQRTFKLVHDPRITPLGRILRKSSIDELPQLWNVLKGEMSLVGPRAPIPAEVRMYRGSDLRRLSVRPGLTCIWQVSGRSNLAFPEQLQLDLKYIEQRSLWLDLKLLILTIPAVLTCQGAY